MILSDFRCPIDDMQLELEEVPLFYEGPTQNVIVGKHLHARVDQALSCPCGHEWTLEGALILSREA